MGLLDDLSGGCAPELGWTFDMVGDFVLSIVMLVGSVG